LYTTNSERDALLQKIKNNDWAAQLVESMKNNVDPKITNHKTNPAGTFSNVPEIRANDLNSESSSSTYARDHGIILSSAAYSAMLYHITQDEKYAGFSADILAYYFDILGTRTEKTTTITGNYFYDPRTTYDQLAVAYDFIYNYLKVPGRKVYSKAENKQVAYDHNKAQKVIRNIAARTLNEAGGADNSIGGPVSNHPILTAPGSIFSIFCVDDKTERERLFDLFWTKGTKRQNSFTRSILKTYSDQYIWPESPSYGFMPNTLLVLNLVDRIKPGLNAAQDYIKLFESPSLLENLRTPNRNFVRYGDSHRKQDGTDDMNRWTLNYAKRRGNIELQRRAEISLKQSFPETNGYSIQVPDRGFGNYNALQLFWGEPLPATSVDPFDYKPTVIINHAGVALQRNYVDVDNKEYGLVGIIGGANYVHAHLTGITMELYGSGDVMAPNGGLPNTLAERRTMPFQGYFNRYAGNNTVIVNGTSHGSSKAIWGGNKEIGQDRTKNIAAEPKHLANPISENFSFATQFLDDNVNDCNQQRTLSTIRTSPTTAYYFDVFRSKSNKTNNFHDYIYHNIGDATRLADRADNELKLTTTTKYQNDIGDEYKSPGWRTFEQTESSVEIDKAVNIRFDLTKTNRYMHMLVPGGVKREYTKALGPATYEALNGYEDKKTQIVAIRQKGEAWQKPFISVFEPSKNSTSSVQSVENLTSGTKIVGAKVVSKVGGKTITDYIISNINANDSYKQTTPAIEFTGRFAVVRVIGEDATLYIGDGESLTYNGTTLTARNRKGIKIVGEPGVDYTPPTGFTFAANGQDTVKINDGKAYDIAFGANGTFEYLRDQTSDVYCYPTSFAKDPLPGIVKKCFTKELPNVAPDVSFNKPTTANVTITQGDAFYVDANIKDANLSFAELFIDGVFLRKESVDPYQWGDFEGANNANELDTLSPGTYTIKVVATDKEGLTGEASFTLNVEAEAPTILHPVGEVSNLAILADAGGFRVTTGALPAELKVTNIQGKVVFSESGVFTNHFVPMKANGVYFIDVVQGEKRITQKYVAVHN